MGGVEFPTEIFGEEKGKVSKNKIVHKCKVVRIAKDFELFYTNVVKMLEILAPYPILMPHQNKNFSKGRGKPLPSDPSPNGCKPNFVLSLLKFEIDPEGRARVQPCILMVIYPPPPNKKT